MRLLSTEYIKNLKSRERDYNISIFIPTFKANKDELNRIGFKNAIKEVKEKLMSDDLDDYRIDSIIKTISKIEDEQDFWSYQAEGLAIYANEHIMEFARLTIHFKQFIYVGNEFYFKPVLPLLEEDNNAYLMAVSPNKIRLFSVSKYEIIEHDISSEFPKDIDESHWFMDREKTLQGHNAGRTIFHGQGGGKDSKEEDVKRFFRDVYTGLEDLFRNEKTQLILAGTDETVNLFKESFHYNFTCEEHIPGNHDDTKSEELYKSAMSILNEKRKLKLRSEILNIKDLKHTKKVERSIKNIVKSSINGKVDKLYIKQNETKWGYLNTDDMSIKLEKSKTNGQLDLLNTAAIETLMNGGEVSIIQDELKNEIDSSAIALLRF